MKPLKSKNDLKNTIELNDDVWLLLYKKGSGQSDCAADNFNNAALKSEEKIVLCMADVNEVRDIHPEYGITSVPALLHFVNGQLRNTIKGCHQPEQLSALFNKTSVVVVSKDGGKAQKRVIVYTTPTCTWCTTIKRHLQENGIRYQEVDVSRDQKAAEAMVRRSGQQGVPQTDINGEIVVGFDKTRLNNLLGIN